LAVNTNAAFNSEDAAWTYDAGSGNARIGVVKKAGAYPKFAHASGAPFTISGSSASDLQSAASGQTLTDEVTVNADHTTTFGYAISVAKQAACPTPISTGGWFWNSNSVLYWVTNTKTNLINDGQ